MTSDIAISAPSEGFRQTGRLAHSRFSPSSVRVSCQSCSWRSLIGGGKCLAKHRMILLPRNQPRATQSSRIRHVLRQGATHQEAPNESFTCTWGTARQKSDHVILRHFCDWLLCSEGRLCPRPSLLPEGAVVRGGDGATTSRLREGLDAVELVTQPMRGGHVRGSASQLLNSIEAGGGGRGS